MTGKLKTFAGAVLYVSALMGLAGTEQTWDQKMLVAAQLQREGNHAEAKTVLLGALKEAERSGPGDARRALTLNRLGSVYQDLGRLREAEKFYQRSLSAWEKIFGLDHPDLARPLSSLVSLYLEDGQYAKAERLLRRSLTHKR
jgi:tetratricopeptide (TPR) repeat protein